MRRGAPGPLAGPAALPTRGETSGAVPFPSLTNYSSQRALLSPALAGPEQVARCPAGAVGRGKSMGSGAVAGREGFSVLGPAPGLWGRTGPRAGRAAGRGNRGERGRASVTPPGGARAPRAGC